ncbi:MAG TPA: hypothetical protein VMM17_03375 [Gemmatimonadaceae bacterium]|nr:hypothetical protein [Gemmatimonadaceae bacterium]
MTMRRTLRPVAFGAVIAGAAVAALACGRQQEERPPRPDTAAVSPPPAPVPDVISIQHERDFELTGDTLPETVRVRATGNSYDSLDVRLEVRARDGTVLYVDGWSSRLYFVYEARAQFSDAEVLRRVRAHLQRLVHDSSYFDPRSGRQRRPIFQVDREHVAYSVAERDWRDEHGVADTMRLHPEAHSEIRAQDASAERVAGLVSELNMVPSFTYYAGGEANYTIAWSPSERRFFTIRACC